MCKVGARICVRYSCHVCHLAVVHRPCQGDKRHDQSIMTLSKIIVKIGGVLSALRLPVQHHIYETDEYNVMIKCGE